jgi:uncharacterized membrane protein YwzB
MLLNFEQLLTNIILFVKHIVFLAISYMAKRQWIKAAFFFEHFIENDDQFREDLYSCIITIFPHNP